MRLRIVLALAALVAMPRLAAAHGINGHIWVTDGALGYMLDCTAAEMLADDAVRPVLQIGASFPDTGYVNDAGRDYGETAHWEPFVESFIAYMRETYAPPYDTLEERQLVAFLMGAAAHGMEDEIFDSIFLRLVEEKDGVSQDWTDPGTDFMLVAEHHTDLQPEPFLPADDLIAVFKRPGIEVPVTEELMHDNMQVVRVVVIGYASFKTDPRIDDEYRPALTWTAEHYLDPRIPSSFPFEKTVVGPYLDAIWHRLHGDFRLSDVVIQTVPARGERLLSTDHTSAFAWPNLIFGYGVLYRSLSAKTVRLLDDRGKAVPFEIGYTRWGNAATDGRLLQLRPLADLAADRDYTVVLEPGVEFIDGRKLDTALRVTFRTACAGGECAPLEAPAAATCPADAPAPAGVETESAGCATSQGAPALALLLAGLWAARRRSSK